MGLFRKKEEKIYTLEKAMELLQKEGYEGYMAVPVDSSNTRFWVKPESDMQAEFAMERAKVRAKAEMDRQNTGNSAFETKRDKFMGEIDHRQMGPGRNLSPASHDIKYSSSNKPGRVVASYNNYQSARKYQKRYGGLSR